jgi:hypothetical protein
MKLSIQAGSTGVSVNIFVQDSDASNGAGLTGLTSSAVSAFYAHPRAQAMEIPLVALSSAAATYSSGGFIEISSANMPGWYRLDIPNGAFASNSRCISVHLEGPEDMAPVPLEIELTAWNNQDPVRGGLTALPNANAAASGGLIINGANTTTVWN